MLNQQLPESQDKRAGGTLDVHSMFSTIQGEGPFAGCAALFIRLAGCNLQCPGCDTEYTSKRTLYSPSELLTRIKEDFEYHDLIVITGGEPFRQHITPLVKLLSHSFYNVQIETNGVLFPGDDFPWTDGRVAVVCSPKTGRIHPKTAAWVHAYKYVLSHDDVHIDGLPVHALGHPLGKHECVARPPDGWDGPIYLQPMDSKDPDENLQNMKAVAKSVMRFKTYIMGVQIHKMVELE